MQALALNTKTGFKSLKSKYFGGKKQVYWFIIFLRLYFKCG